MKNLFDMSPLIFVFGSNLSGIHGAGAARYAMKHRGAMMGVGEGITGQCYALPTKGKMITFMNLDTINTHVQKFIKHARDHSEQQFQVTQVGCGLGGWSREDIAPMFEYAPDNCYFDTVWKPLLPESAKFWGTF